MGALRAVECAKYGMVGIGTVFEWYRDHIITADDEVALTHEDEDSGFRSSSLPLVNIRASLSDAVESGNLSREIADETLRWAKLLYYPDRNVPQILLECQHGGLDAADQQCVREVLTTGYRDIKAADARTLLRKLARASAGEEDIPKAVPFKFGGSASFDTLFDLDRVIHSDDNGLRVSLQSVAGYAALYYSDFEEIRRRALERQVTLFFGLMLTISPSPEEVRNERTRFLASRGIKDNAELNQWRDANCVSHSHFAQLMVEEALCRRVRNWAVSLRSFDRGCRALMDQMRIDGKFTEALQAAIEFQEIYDKFAHEPRSVAVREASPSHLAERHARASGVVITGDAEEWAEERGLDGVGELANVLGKASIVNDVRERASRALEIMTAHYSNPDSVIR